jgi:hypothetical protein
VSLPAFDSAKFAFPSRNAETADQWIRSLDLIDGAARSGVLDAPVRVLRTPTSQDVPEYTRALDKLNQFRVRALAEQLWLLGYLPEKPRKNLSRKVQTTPSFRNAVSKFQAEAGLVVDGWSGDQTWRALNAMVAFESWTAVEEWADAENGFCRAFRRAIHLRLHKYGLANGTPSAGFSTLPPQNSLRAVHCLQSLGVVDRSSEPSMLEWVRALFDHDKLVTAAGRFELSFESTLDQGESHRRDLRSFLVNLAKIELWLLGSDVSIDGQDDYPVAGLGVAQKRISAGGKYRRKVNATNTTFRKYLTEYWHRLLGLSNREAKKRARAVTPALFRSLDQPSDFSPDAGDPLDESDYSVSIAERFWSADGQSTDSLVANSYSIATRIGMNLFDGLKRLWRWVKQGVSSAVDFGVNLLRGFYRFALKSFYIVQTATTAFASSLRQYAAGRIDTCPRIAVSISNDFDSQALIFADASADHVKESALSVKKFATAFYLSAKILSIMVRLLVSAYQGLAGWVRFLMILVRHYRDLSIAYQEFSAALDR